MGSECAPDCDVCEGGEKKFEAFGRLGGEVPLRSNPARRDGRPLCLVDWRRGVGSNGVKDVLGLGEGEEAVAGGFLEGGGVLFSCTMTVEWEEEAAASDQTVQEEVKPGNH